MTHTYDFLYRYFSPKMRLRIIDYKVENNLVYVTIEYIDFKDDTLEQVEIKEVKTIPLLDYITFVINDN